MIVRILGEGQLDLSEADIDALNDLDAQVAAAVDEGNEAGFRSALTALLDAVREAGMAVPDDELATSDLILPPSDASIEEVRELLSEDGLIPG